jgi:hypothetical protein
MKRGNTLRGVPLGMVAVPELLSVEKTRSIYELEQSVGV